MRTIVCGTIALALLVVLVGQARSDDQADAKAVLDEAIKAAGGKERVSPLAKEPFTWNSKITGQTADGNDIKLAETGHVQGKMVRIEHEGTVGDRKVNRVQVYDGEKAYLKEGDETKEM